METISSATDIGVDEAFSAVRTLLVQETSFPVAALAPIVERRHSNESEYS
jgi:hypothetical protein